MSEVVDDVIGADLEPIPYRLDNTSVRLVGNDQGKIVGVDTCLRTRLMQHTDHFADGLAKDPPSVHLHKSAARGGHTKRRAIFPAGRKHGTAQQCF